MREENNPDLGNQSDQMARLFVQNLAIKTMKICPKPDYCQIRFEKFQILNRQQKNAKDFKKFTKFDSYCWQLTHRSPIHILVHIMPTMARCM